MTFTKDAPTAFPVGITRVTRMVADFSGHSDSAMLKIIVVDTIAAVATAPDDTIAILTGEKIPLDIGQTTNDKILYGTLTNDAPDAFPVGTTLGSLLKLWTVW